MTYNPNLDLVLKEVYTSVNNNKARLVKYKDDLEYALQIGLKKKEGKDAKLH